MSFKDLAGKIAKIRTGLLTEMSICKYNGLNDDKSKTKAMVLESELEQINLLYDKALNGIGNINELYIEASKYGVPLQQFAR